MIRTIGRNRLYYYSSYFIYQRLHTLSYSLTVLTLFGAGLERSFALNRKQNTKMPRKNARGTAGRVRIGADTLVTLQPCS